ncbi:unknown [Prevotella sp. CAG:592]|nr:unknown [Prevotella sp. CAG:592]
MLKVCKKFDLALQGKKGPLAKDLRKMAFMKDLYGE